MKTMQNCSPLIAHEVTPLVLRLVAEAYQLTVRELCSSDRARHIGEPRSVAWWIVRMMTDAPWTMIAKLTGGWNHTSVISGYSRIARLRERQPFLRDAIDSIWVKALAEAEPKLGKGVLRAPEKRAA